MCPDIEWQVDDDSGQQTVAKTSAPKRSSRWQKIAIGFVIFLGIGLGVIYRSIPEPPPRPTPASVPLITPTVPPPPGVVATIDREAQALADGDLRTFQSIQDPDDAAWQQHQLDPSVFNAWGRPRLGALYTIVESAALSDRQAWADVVQFRDGQYFRETRFYRLRDDRWVRMRPTFDAAVWGNPQTLDLGHFSVTFYEKDEALARIVTAEYERVYQQVCGDLACADETGASPVDKFDLVLIDLPQIDPSQAQMDLLPMYLWLNQRSSFVLSPPRLTGVYIPDQNDRPVSCDQPVEREACYNLSFRIASDLSGGSTHWLQTSNGFAFAWAIGYWEVMRLTPGASTLFQPYFLASHDEPLESIWTGYGSFARIEATILIKLVEDRYGSAAVAKLLRAIPKATSVPDLMKLSGLSYADLQQDWQNWLKEFRSTQ